MAAKGRSGRAKAAQQTGAASTAAPVRKIKPFTPVNDLNGANLRELDYYKILTTLNDAEAAAWLAGPGRLLGRGAVAGMLPATYLLSELLKELPSVVTFVPADPDEDWRSCASWLATTKAPQYRPNGGGRMIDPDFAAEGATPLLAALALLQNRIDRKLWAWSGTTGAPRFHHYATVYPNG